MEQAEFERIESFLLGKMSSAEEAKMRNDISENPRLEAAVEEFREGILAIEFGAFQEKLSDIAQDYEKRHPDISGLEIQNSKKFNYSRLLLFAAGLALLFSLVYVFQAQAPEEELFVEHFSPDPGLPVSMGAPDGAYQFKDAMVDYRAGKYDTAIEKWAGLHKTGLRGDTLSYYLASAYLNQGQSQEAIHWYKDCIAQNKTELQHRAQWYLALCYLKTGETKNIESIPFDENEYYGRKILQLRSAISQL